MQSLARIDIGGLLSYTKYLYFHVTGSHNWTMAEWLHSENPPLGFSSQRAYNPIFYVILQPNIQHGYYNKHFGPYI